MKAVEVYHSGKFLVRDCIEFNRNCNHLNSSSDTLVNIKSKYPSKIPVSAIAKFIAQHISINSRIADFIRAKSQGESASRSRTQAIPGTSGHHISRLPVDNSKAIED